MVSKKPKNIRYKPSSRKTLVLLDKKQKKTKKNKISDEEMKELTKAVVKRKLRQITPR